MKKELIIWDFDGVIADTESLWLYNRMTTINETFHLNWTFEKTVNTLLGMSDKTKREVLDNLGIRTDDEFWLKNKKLDNIKFANHWRQPVVCEFQADF